MFDIGWAEMAVIMLVALIVIGPKDLPRVARTVGRWVGKGRALAREFQTQLEEMAREAELDKVKQEIERAGRGNIGKTIEKTIDPTGELSTAFDPNAKTGQPDKAIPGAKAAQGDGATQGGTAEAGAAQGGAPKGGPDAHSTARPTDGNGDASRANERPAARPAERPVAETRAAERESVPADPG
jgi:sec-independent protein translocase protein TatB